MEWVWQHRFTVPVVDIDTYSLQIGEIVYEINVIDLSVDNQTFQKTRMTTNALTPRLKKKAGSLRRYARRRSNLPSCLSFYPFANVMRPNVLGNELTVILQDVKDAGYTPTD